MSPNSRRGSSALPVAQGPQGEAPGFGVLLDGLLKLAIGDIGIALIDFVRGEGDGLLITAGSLRVARGDEREPPIHFADAVDVEAHRRVGERAT